MWKQTAILGCTVMMMATTFAAVVDAAGRPYREIVVASQAPDSVRLAGRELQQFLKELCGADLPIVAAPTGAKPAIFVGNSDETLRLGVDPAAMPTEGFRIKTTPDALVIAGRDYAGTPLFGWQNPWRSLETYNPELKLAALGEAGTLSGVYAFLEDFGNVRFYWPGELGTVIDPVETLTVPAIDQTTAPRFTYRYPWFSMFECSPESALWFHRVGFGGKAPVIITHNYRIIQKYKDTNPEFFALTADGKRAFGFECVADGQGHLCLNNPELIDRWAQDIIEYFEQNPEMEVYPLGPNDGLNRICACPACQADLRPDAPEHGKFSYHIWNFTNKVARKVAARFPDKFVGCLAYEEYRTPPEGLELEPNVAVMFCHARSSLVNPAERDKLHAEIEAWSKHAHRIYLWDWYLTHWAPWNNLPILYSGAIQEELRYLAANPAVMGEFIENETPPGHPDGIHGFDRMVTPGMQHLNLYLTAKLYWNPELDVRALLDEYYQRFYGPAAAPMGKFWDRAEARRNELAGADLKTAPDQLFNPEFLQELQGYLDEARKLAPPDSVYAKRIAVVADEFQVGTSRLTRLLQQGASKLVVPKIRDRTELDTQTPMRFMSRDGQAVKPPTWVYAGYDRENLYLRFLCYEPAMDKLKTAVTEHDGADLWNDDCLDLLICPSADDRGRCFQILVNAAGVILDGEKVSAPTLESGWESRARAEVRREPNRWILDLTIPFAPLGINDPNFTGDLAANFYRCRQAGEKSTEFSCWSPTGEGYHFVPEKFGILTLEKQ